MLTLASMIWAAYLYVADIMHMRHNVPPPVVVETGQEYKYNGIESAMYVPASWNDNCYNQEQTVLKMAEHFNNFRNGKQKLSEDKLIIIAHKWKCVTDEAQ